MKCIVILVLSLLLHNNAQAQCFPVDTAKLNAGYRELTNLPNTLERQKAFFDAFPENWREFIGTYQYVPDKGYDLSMYGQAYEHIDALNTRMALIEDSVYCKKSKQLKTLTR